jgi:hypothetical protein
MSEGSECILICKTLNNKVTPTKTRKFLPLIATDDADQEMQKPGTTEGTEKHGGQVVIIFY